MKEDSLDPPVYIDRSPVLLSHLAATLKRYRVAIGLSVLAGMLLYAIAATIAYLVAPSQRIASMPFRLEFNGANLGAYPNGLPFSTADITANPVLLEVFHANDLGRFITFEQFSRALFVMESNRELERLTAEYQVKLADPKLTPVDRERLEREFESKRASISKSDYAIEFHTRRAADDVPAPVVRKMLNDVLAVWARRAAVEKRVFDFQVPTLSANILEDHGSASENYLISLLRLRRRVTDVMNNIDTIKQIPGAELVRTATEKVSIEEARVRVDEITRFQLDPLIMTARSSGHLGSTPEAVQILQAQLAHDQRLLTSARMREEALRNALRVYESERVVGVAGTAPAGTDTGRTAETVMPQLSESFLDRILDISSRNADRDYRQRLTDEIKHASLAVIPAEEAVRFDQELIASFGDSAVRVNPEARERVESEWREIVSHLRHVVGQVNEIYQIASQQLNSSTMLFRITGPPIFRVERAIALARLGLGALLAFLIVLPATIAGVLLHNRIREESAMEAAAAEPTAR